MTWIKRLEADRNSAMKARDAVRLATLRLLLSEFQNAAIAKGGELSEDEGLQLVVRATKKRREAITAYEGAGRAELADAERAELSVLEDYLPQQLTVAEVRELIGDLIRELGAESRRDMGRVMGQLMPRIKGRFPGKEVRAIVEEALDAVAGA